MAIMMPLIVARVLLAIFSLGNFTVTGYSFNLTGLFI